MNTFSLLILVLINLISLQYICQSAIIHPSKEFSVTFKEGFIIHLNTTFGKNEKCFYRMGEQEPIEINLNAKEPQKHESGESILPYSKTICGIRVDNVSYAASEKWTLIIQHTKGEPTSESVTVKVIAPPKLNFETLHKLELGQASIKCSKTKIAPEPSYCKIYSDLNILHDSCNDFLSIVVRNKTSFKCNTLTWSVFSQSKETILIQPIVKTVSGIKANYTENNDYVTMACQYPGSTGPCKGEYPDRLKGVFITDGLLSGRLSTLDTSMSNGKCVLEIKKPLKSEEIGIWTISRSDQSGCMFYVGDDQSKIIQRAVDLIKPVQYLEIINKSYVDSSFIIRCKAPFPLETCYLVDPNNKIHFPDSFKFSTSKNLGYYDFRMDIIPGEYICGLNGGKIYKDEITYKYNVKVVSSSGEAVSPIIKTDLGESVELLCRVPFDTISHCAFIDPKRNVYYLSNFIKPQKKSRISYFGDGLEQGHCGIKVQNVQADDLGYWKCHIKSGYSRASSFDIKVELIYHGLSEASSIGLGVGVASILVLFSISAVFYCKRKNALRRERERSANESVEMTRRDHAERDRSEGQCSYASKES